MSLERDGVTFFRRIRTRLGIGHFPTFSVGVTFHHLILLFDRSYRAEIIVLKRPIQARSNVAKRRVEVFKTGSKPSFG